CSIVTIFYYLWSRINLIDARSACYTLAVSNYYRKKHVHSTMSFRNAKCKEKI
ncbi:conserved hypothetical protein, partial [Trichinella spiralis]|uniref:hypothetical protein n=1 Tax=Trichinella spiralis TaxID=6334 RepID=UPI0001EFD492